MAHWLNSRFLGIVAATTHHACNVAVGRYNISRLHSITSLLNIAIFCWLYSYNSKVSINVFQQKKRAHTQTNIYIMIHAHIYILYTKYHGIYPLNYTTIFPKHHSPSDGEKKNENVAGLSLCSKSGFRVQVSRHCNPFPSRLMGETWRNQWESNRIEYMEVRKCTIFLAIFCGDIPWNLGP
jgi:hypothetical protein